MEENDTGAQKRREHWSDEKRRSSLIEDQLVTTWWHVSSARRVGGPAGNIKGEEKKSSSCLEPRSDHCRQEQGRRRRAITFEFSLKMVADQTHDLKDDVALGSDGPTLGIAT